MHKGDTDISLIHIGYHKTGTSWLQRYYFSSELLGYYTPLPNPFVRDHMVQPHPLNFDATRTRKNLDNCFKYKEGLCPVISHERLSGNPHSGGFDTTIIAGRIKEIYPNARILIIFREQSKIILSCYRQYIRAGGIAKLKQYLYPVQRHRIPQFSFDYFKYDVVVSLYNELFGAMNVLALPYEIFRNQPLEFFSRINAFCQIDIDDDTLQKVPIHVRENRALQNIALQRRLNRYWRRSDFNPAPFVDLYRRGKGLFDYGVKKVEELTPRAMSQKVESRLISSIEQEITHRYLDSNQRLSDLTGWNLRDLGYTLSESRAPEESSQGANGALDPNRSQLA